MAKSLKARKPVLKRGIETKAKLIEAANAAFIEKGYHKTNSKEISARAGLAIGTFYSYFNDKKEVLIDLVRQQYQQGRDDVLSKLDEDILKTGNWKVIIHTLVQVMYSIHTIRRDLHRTVYPMIFLDKDIFDIFHQEEIKNIYLLASLFEKHINMLRITDTLAAAELTYRACDEVLHRIIFWGGYSDSKNLIRELEDMLYQYLVLT